MQFEVRDEGTPRAALDAAAQAVELFVRLSAQRFDERTGWQYPSDAYDCAGALTELVVLLPGVFERLVAAVRGQHELSLVGIDSGPHDRDPGAAVEAVGGALHGAGVAAQQMLAGLTEAHGVLARMFYGGPESWPMGSA